MEKLFNFFSEGGKTEQCARACENFATLKSACENFTTPNPSYENFATQNLSCENFANQFCLVKSDAKLEKPVQTHFANQLCLAKTL